jgi:hypothetical protein
MTLQPPGSPSASPHDVSNLAIALITALVTLLVAVASAIAGYFISSIRERETNWRSLKIEFYKDFISTHAGIVDGDATGEDRLKFSRSCNRLSLIASRGVLKALDDYLSQISVSNSARTAETEDILRRKLIWEMRKDIGYVPYKTTFSEFKAPFRTSGN